MISVVVPVWNEEHTLQELYERLIRVFTALRKEYEIVFVDDGSHDRSREILRSLSARDRKVRVIFLSRNFNQHAAIAAGFFYAKGEQVILMDADLQDIPEEIPKLLSKLEEGYDVVYGVRVRREDSFFKNMSSKIFFSVFEKVLECRLPRGVSTFRVLNRRAIEAFNAMKEHSRFTAGMMAWLGFPYAVVEIKHVGRKEGKSKYNFLKLIKLSLDGIFSFSDYPLKLASHVGILLSFTAFLMSGYMVIKKLTTGFVITGYASLIVALFFLGGLQIFFLGITGEYIARIFKDVQGRPIYVVKETINL